MEYISNIKKKQNKTKQSFNLNNCSSAFFCVCVCVCVWQKLQQTHNQWALTDRKKQTEKNMVQEILNFFFFFLKTIHDDRVKFNHLLLLGSTFFVNSCHHLTLWLWIMFFFRLNRILAFGFFPVFVFFCFCFFKKCKYKQTAKKIEI